MISDARKDTLIFTYILLFFNLFSLNAKYNILLFKFYHHHYCYRFIIIIIIIIITIIPHHPALKH